jgi:hypothetical protein
MKICPVGVELFQTDMTKLIIAFCNFANGPNKIRKSFTNPTEASGDFLTCICLVSRLFSYDLGHRTFRDLTPGLLGGGGRETMNFIYCCWCRRILSTMHRVLSVAMEVQFALLSSCEIFGIVVNNNKRSVL